MVVTHRVGASHRSLLLSASDYPVLCETLLLLGQLTLGIRNRLQRYMTLYKAYEAVTDRPDPSLRSLRNAVAHPATMLTSALTLSELTRLFGSRFFAIDIPEHQRVFFIHMAQLLIFTDRRLGRLLEHTHRAVTLPTRRDALHDWQVHGGWETPIPLEPA